MILDYTYIDTDHESIHFTVPGHIKSTPTTWISWIVSWRHREARKSRRSTWQRIPQLK